VWATSYAGRTVVWRGDRFLLKHGRLLRTRPSAREQSSSAVEL